MKKKGTKELIDSIRQNRDRMLEMAETIERENREFTEAEEAEYKTLKRDLGILRMKLDCINNGALDAQRDSVTTLTRSAVQEALASGSKNPLKYVLVRDIQGTEALEGTGIIPVEEGEMLKPLRAGLIYDKVGINIRTGLIGTLRWPKHGKLTAKWAGEKEKITASAIDWDKITVAPRRLSVAAELSRQELFQSDGAVESVYTEEMPNSIIERINEALFTTEKGDNLVYGPFVTAGKSGGCPKVTFAGALPTRKELLGMKAKIAAAGITPSTCCFVMTEATKAELEDISVDKGSGRFICENDRIFGYPVFTTDFIGEGNIGFGDWSYQAAGFFGQMSFIMDPYSLAMEDSTRFVLNIDFATVTLRPEAFVLGVPTK